MVDRHSLESSQLPRSPTLPAPWLGAQLLGCGAAAHGHGVDSGQQKHTNYPVTSEATTEQFSVASIFRYTAGRL